MVVVGREEKRRENETEGKEKVKECAAIAMAERLMRRKERTRRQKNERKEFITSICKPLFVTMIVNKMENTVCNECVPEFHPSNWFTRYDSFIFFFYSSSNFYSKEKIIFGISKQSYLPLFFFCTFSSLSFYILFCRKYMNSLV